MSPASSARSRRREDRRRRRKIGLADLHVDDAAAGRFERSRGRLHFHHVERRDGGDARGKGGAGRPSKGIDRKGAKSVMVMVAPRSSHLRRPWMASCQRVEDRQCHSDRSNGSAFPRRLRSPPSQSSRRPPMPTSTNAPATAAHPSTRKCPALPGKELRNFQTNPPEITVLPGNRPGANPTVTPTSRAKANETAEKAPKAAPAAKGKGDPSERQHARVGMTEAEVWRSSARPTS